MSEMDDKGKHLEELLRMRSQLDQELRAKYTQEVSILFTDIKGSTRYFETRGDLAGRAMVQAHNDLLLPMIERHGGRLIKTIGDAIMASFQVPMDAVETAIDMQRALREHNRRREVAEQINVRIGINAGLALVEQTDVYGDVVNTAARVESIADGGEILVSGSVYDAVKNSDDIIMRYHSAAEVKGKNEPVEVYRVVWDEYLELTQHAPDIAYSAVRGAGSEEDRVLTIEFTHGPQKLKISASEKSVWQEKTLRHYEEKDVDDAVVAKLCADTINLLNRANKRGKVSAEILVQLKEAGQQLYDMLMTPKAKELVSSTQAESLIINIDDRLVHIPWELLHYGEGFLCQRFAMGRIVATRQPLAAMKQRKLQRPLKMLVLADPKGDLQASYREGVAIRDEMDKLPKEGVANLRTGPINADYVKAKMRNYDILHYAGHADYDRAEPGNSGWLLEGGKVTARDVLEMSGNQPMPALVFSNACHSGQTEEWSLKEDYANEIYGLANAFLLAGVQHYIGTFWEVLDEPSASFAIYFYGELMRGATVGRAVQAARRHLIKQYGEETIVWSSYMLYGDPTYMYKKDAPAIHMPKTVSEAQPAAAEPVLAGGPPRAAGAATVAAPYPAQTTAAAHEKKTPLALYAAIALIAIVIGSAGAYMMKRPASAPATAVSSAPAQISAGTGQTASPPGGGRAQGPVMAKAYATRPASETGEAAKTETATEAGRDKPAESAAKSARIRQLAKDLVARYKEQGGAAPAVQGDRPLTVAFIDFTSKTQAAGKQGEDQFLLAALQDKVVESGKVQVVERDLIEAVLNELDLSTSDLADQKVALRLGKVLSARYITTGSLYRMGGEYRVSMRVIETETTSVKASISQSGKGNMDVDKVAGSLADQLVKKLTKEGGK